MEIKDLKVVELASVLAGPAVGMFFAELGARVIKVENKVQGGDVTRSWKTGSENPDSPVSAYFSSINYGKEYLKLNLKNETDHARCVELIKDADIVISNFLPNSAARLKLDFESVKSINPRIIYGEILGYKEDKRAAYDVVLQAETGFMSMNGDAEGMPTKIPLAIIDMFAAHQLKQGLLVALLKGDNRAVHVRVTLEEAALAALANQASNYLMTGRVPVRMGSLHPNIAPYGEILRTHDNHLMVLAIGNDQQFTDFCNILDLNELAGDLKYNSNKTRVLNRLELIELLQSAAQNFEFEDLFAACKQRKVPVGKVNNLDTVLSGSVAQNMILSEEIDGIETQRMKTAAFTIH